MHCVPHSQAFAAAQEASTQPGAKTVLLQGNDPALDNPAPSPDQKVCAYGGGDQGRVRKAWIGEKGVKDILK